LQDVEVGLQVESAKKVVQIVIRLLRFLCIEVLEKCQEVLCDMIVTVE
jgi:hypothetical protein